MSRYMDFNAWELIKKLLLNKEDVVNNLTSTDIEKPLSANMGKELNENKISKTYIGSGAYVSLYPYMIAGFGNSNKNLLIKVGNLKYNLNAMMKIDLSINDVYGNATNLSITFYQYTAENIFYGPSFTSSNKKYKYSVQLCTDNNNYVYIFVTPISGATINYPSIIIDKVVCNYALPSKGTFESGWQVKVVENLNSFNRVTNCSDYG